MELFRLLSKFVLFHLLILKTKSDFFTSVVGLEKLLNTKKEVVQILGKYLEFEEERLDKIRTYKDEYQHFVDNASPDVESFILNPINAYLLIKKLSADWETVKSLLKSDWEMVENEVSRIPQIQFPDEEDLSGAAEAVVRLQKMYQLNTSSLASGYIMGKRTAQNFTAGDCFEIGRQAYSEGDFYYCSLWMQEALNRLELEVTDTANREEVLELLAYSYYMLDDLDEAMKLTLDLLEIVPDHARALNNKQYFEIAITNKKRKEQNFTNETEVEKYRRLTEPLCREQNKQSIGEKSRMNCRYHTNNNSYLLLQPLKEEELSLHPKVVLYHNFLTDEDIEIVKRLAQPKLKRAAVSTSVDGEEAYSSYRISKSAWLSDEEHHSIEKMSRLIGYATGLSLETAEELQVLNYGIGGHYEAHFDFARDTDEIDSGRTKITGDRIATWLNYMTDVDIGGATVFPEIGISVKPVKGSAILWYNLHRNGTGDVRTRHAACPVMLGSKWVSNKWIRERGQEFRRQCSLQNE